ncbi:MAG: (2Fe-2S)-binding protein [Candidatus Zixiibacteriota bacterium]|nr:MAG: (2Fe-2S)-binding protein [candidate division Zixibacteria bacterium]
MPRILFLNDETVAEVPEGASILEAALDNGVSINNDCGANGACGTCHVFIDEGLDNVTAMEGDEAELLEMVEGATGRSRLACQARILGDIIVTIPE